MHNCKICFDDNEKNRDKVQGNAENFSKKTFQETCLEWGLPLKLISNAEQKGKSVKSDDDEMYLQAIITVFSHRELSAVSSDDLHSKNIK